LLVLRFWPLGGFLAKALSAAHLGRNVRSPRFQLAQVSQFLTKSDKVKDFWL